MKQLGKIATSGGQWSIGGAPEGVHGLFLANLAPETAGNDLIFIARDGNRLREVEGALKFFAPDRDVLTFPAWDCLPYDRVSPAPEIVAERLASLSSLANPRPAGAKARIILVSVTAAIQRLPLPEVYKHAGLAIGAGTQLAQEALLAALVANGYRRSDTVMEPGDFAVRGGIVDFFAPGLDSPVRVDLFGDHVESLRAFDPMTQRSTANLQQALVAPTSEVLLNDASIARFRGAYRELFGAASAEDPLYEAISAGRRFAGMEHWLPLFHERLGTIFDFTPGAVVVLDDRLEEAFKSRREMIDDHFQARASMQHSGRERTAPLYRPVPANLLYLDDSEWQKHLAARPLAALSAFETPVSGPRSFSLGARRHEGFAAVRTQPGANLIDAVVKRVAEAHQAGRRVLLAVFSAGAAERLLHLLHEHGLQATAPAENYQALLALKAGIAGVAVVPIETGFLLDDLETISEEDIFGDRLVRPIAKRRASERFIAEASSLAAGDLVVHREHGIGRYDGLATLEIQDARHDCLRLIYEGGDKLFVPVENIEVLSRFGAEDAITSLDRLGGVAWQSRKARLKQRIRDIADKLIKVAAERAVRNGEVFAPPEGSYDEFCARFPYAETDDQTVAIADVIEDLAAGKPMDRLICGDVGFGKTEIALRAAFVVAMSGKQVAVIAPTTLLARQHFATFSQRFAGFALRLGRLSRLVNAKEQAATKKALGEGKVDIVIGTHALLGKAIDFSDLGLVIVDEEQHFGVAHKERLKELRSDVHVLTLTATPIPRTLQMALSGVRDMSLIATPPVDRLAVRTYVTPYDPVPVREALMREHYRGGQSFYVCPRIEDLDFVARELRELVPELKFAMAHGRMAPTQLEDTMSAFVDGRYDMLLSTNIVESGLDIPRANTMIMHHADMFGLAQLYQLRGRIGRSKARAYCYLTVASDKALTEAAQRRLEVMQALDTLGAGFQLASHDLDIRGAGNLLGEEQSGHIREVGIELYQQLLDEAVHAAKFGGEKMESDDWSPQISLGLPVLIPEDYVPDLSVRLALYRRAGALVDRPDIDSFAAELADRFGKLPPETENLLGVVELKARCREANIEKVDAGPKGAIIAFRRNQFANPEALIGYINQQAPLMRVRPDQRVVIAADLEDPRKRLPQLMASVSILAKLALPAK